MTQRRPLFAGIVCLTIGLPMAGAWAAGVTQTQLAPPVEEVRQAEVARASAQKAQENARAKAAAAAEQEQAVADARIAATAKLRALEADLAISANRVTEFWRRRQEAQVEFDEHNAAIATLVPVIGRLSHFPAETMLVLPQSPEDSVRGLLVLNAITREVGDEMRQLQKDQLQLDALGRELAAAQADLAARQVAQAREAAALDAQIADARINRTTAEGEAAEWARKAAEQAARAETLRQAIASLEAANRAEAAREPPAVRQEAAAKLPGLSGGLIVPVAGTLVRRFGEEVDGTASTGIAYQSAPSARVEAACASRVVFAGNFRSFGLLTILDCGAGYHAVLSGFDQLNVQLGQNLRQGEPVGTMPGWNPLSLGRKPLLLFELRHDGQPVDPAPLLRAAG